MALSLKKPQLDLVLMKQNEFYDKTAEFYIKIEGLLKEQNDLIKSILDTKK